MKRWLAPFIGLLLSLTAVFADAPHHRPVWMGGNGPVFYANPAATGVIPSGLAHTWGTTPTSPAYYFDAAGNLQASPNNQIRNSVPTGGVTPSTWVINSATAGINVQIVGTGTEVGLPYIDVRFYGTVSSTGYPVIFLETSNGIPASIGQRLLNSVYLKNAPSSAGVNPVSWGFKTQTYNSALIGLSQDSDFSYAAPVSSGSLLSTGRYWATNIPSAAATAYAAPFLVSTLNAGTAYDFTLRVGAPQLELVTAAQTTPNPFMPTSGSAYYGPVVNDHNPSTLAALGLRSEPQQTNLFLNNLAPVTQTITVASGTVYTVSFYGTGSIVLSGAAAQTMTGSAGVGTQYTFTAGSTSLTATVSGLSATSYAQVEANAYATSPVLTYGTAVMVPADNWSFTGAANTALTLSKGCIVVEFTPAYVPNINPRIIGAANSAGLIQASFFGLVSTWNLTAELDTGVTMVAGVKVRGGYAWNGATRSIVANGNAPASDTAGTSITPGMQIYFGQDNTGPKTGLWGSQIMIRPSCTAAQVQRYSTAGANLQAENDNDWPVFADISYKLMLSQD